MAVEVLAEPVAVAVGVAVRLGGGAARMAPQSAVAEFPLGSLAISCAMLRQRIVSPAAATKSFSGSAVVSGEPYAQAFACMANPASPRIVRISSSGADFEDVQFDESLLPKILGGF